MNWAIRRALDDASPILEARGVLTTVHLEATEPFDSAPPALEQALYTVFRGLPERLFRGSTLYVRTMDRAGGDIELLWEAREPGRSENEDLPLRELVRSGPFGDLLELALLGLETICRARISHDSTAEIANSSAVLTRSLRVKRRYLFLLPAPDRLAAPRQGLAR